MTDPRIILGMTAQLAQRRTRIAAGEKPLGWKVGFGAPAAMKMLNIGAPLLGYLMQSALLEHNADVPLDGWTKPAAEAEIAVHMDKDLGPNMDRAAIQAAIAGISPAIELADVIFAPDDVEKILTGNIYQRHVILGACDTSRAGEVIITGSITPPLWIENNETLEFALEPVGSLCVRFGNVSRT